MTMLSRARSHWLEDLRLGLERAAERPSKRAILSGLVVLNLALWLWTSAQFTINPDGFLYITQARMVAAGRYAEALLLYDWPAYSILIGTLSMLTGVDALHVGAALNAVAHTLCMIVVLATVSEASKERSVWIAAAVLVFGNLWWNELRGTVIREHLFLLLMLVGFHSMVRDLHAASWRNWIVFVATGCAAALFRFEALLFVAIIPLTRILLECSDRRVRTLTFGIIAAVAVLSPYGLVYWKSSAGLSQLFESVGERVGIIREQILDPFLEGRMALVGYVSMAAGIILFKFVKALGVANIALSAYAARQSKQLPPRVLHLALLYVLTGFLLASVQIFFNFIFDPRHGLLMSLVLTVPAAFGLVELHRRFWSAQRDRAVAIFGCAIGGLLLYGFFGGVRFYDPHRFVWSAVDWLKTNAPQDASVLTNNGQITFYAGFPLWDQDFAITAARRNSISYLRNWREYDYVVLQLRQSRLYFGDEVRREAGVDPVATFENRRGDRIVVFRMKP